METELPGRPISVGLHGRPGTILRAFLSAVALSLLAPGCVSRLEKVTRLRNVQGVEQQAEAAATLIQIAQDNAQKPRIRTAAVESLACLDRTEALPVFGALAVTDPDPAVRRWAVWALGLQDDPAAAAYLLQAAGGCADAEAVQQLLESLSGFLDVLKDDAEARLRVVRLVRDAERSYRSSVPVLRYAGVFRHELENLPVALTLLQELRPTQDAPQLRPALCTVGDLLLEGQDTDDETRAAAVDALADLLTHADPAVRLSALWFLGRIADARTAPALLAAARARADRATRMLALWALERTDAGLLRAEFTPLPDDLLAVTPENWRDACRAAVEAGEPDLEIQRFIRRTVREEAGR